MGIKVPKNEVKATAARVVKSGHIHEAGAAARVGYYADTLDVPIGGQLLLHTTEWVKIDAPSGLVLAVGALVNFDFATQAAVASGGTNIGRCVYAKTSGQTSLVVALNSTGLATT